MPFKKLFQTGAYHKVIKIGIQVKSNTRKPVLYKAQCINNVTKLNLRF